MLILSKLILIFFAAWLLAVAVICLLRPQKALTYLAKMGSTPLIHFGEHILRGAVGLAFMGVAAQTPYPVIFKLFGGFVVISSLLIMLAPRRWHHRYAQYWADALEPWMVRAIGAVTVIGTGYLISVVF